MAATEAPPKWPDVLETKELQEKIRTAKVLAVGAGGIGCELLKTLVLSGFEDIEVVDLDTIETSNLNRQFLFRKHHVGKSKAEVAAEVVRSFAPRAKIVAHQANVKEPRFGLDFVRSKDLVLNGLDNLEARRHVNRLCVAGGVPLVESGTAGHKGQVTVHIKGLTECYECTHRAAQQRSYPVCTLRNTPDKPIHCIVWAKEMLFGRLFGRPEELTDLDEQTAASKDGPAHAAANGAADDAGARESDQEEAAAAAAEEARELAGFFARGKGEAALGYARRVFGRVFASDIEKVVGMAELWKTRRPPAPLSLAALLPDETAAAAEVAAAAAAAAKGGGGGGGVARALGLGDHQVWSDADAAKVFLAAVVAFLEGRPGEVGSAVFDKDDALAVDFVTAAANLRSSCYAIPPQSAFAAKGMAGNIIHAIATTNAAVAGLLVTEAIKVIAGMPSECRTSFLYERVVWSGRKKAPTGQLVGAVPCPPPRPGCVVCGKARLQLTIDTGATTLGQLLDKVIRRGLAVNDATLISGGFMYEEGEGLEDDEVEENRRKLPLAMRELPGGGLGQGAVLAVNDQSQAFSVELVINHSDSIDEEKHPEGFILEGQLPPAQQPGAGEPGAAAGAGTAAEADQQQQRQGGAKRARGGGEGGAAGDDGAAGAGAEAPDAKRARQGDGGGGGGGAAAGGAEDDDGVILVSSDDEVL
ncbi:MAG: hypothetical protein J3K34DRAFT_483471 [Monoraphidium minutum]|nr:MAG: hypothetical protein J3K34DRAFT_483471 [Monoraphidium minutum]